jgi:hypothetical protein
MRFGLPSIPQDDPVVQEQIASTPARDGTLRFMCRREAMMTASSSIAGKVDLGSVGRVP